MKLEPGILAFIVNSNAGNSGKIVEVGQCLGEDAHWEGRRWNKGSVSWLCTSLGGPITTSKGRELMTLPIAQENLKPIEPLKDDDKVDEDVDVPVKESKDA